MSVKVKDKFELAAKLALIGIAGVAIMSAAYFSKDLVKIYEKQDYITEIRGAVKQMKDEGFLMGVRTGVTPYIHSEKNTLGSFAIFKDRENKICEINMALGGETANLMSYPYSDKQIVGDKLEQEDRNVLNGLLGTNEKVLAGVKHTARHEAAHCDELNFEDSFKIEGNEKLTRMLNDLYGGPVLNLEGTLKYLGEKQYIDNFSNLLSEGYAESVSSILLVKDQSVSPDVSTAVLQNRELLLGVTRAASIKRDIDVAKHSTEAIPRFFQTQEGINKAKSLNTADEIRNYSMDLANKNFLEILSTKNVDEMLGANYWDKLTLSAWKYETLYTQHMVGRSAADINFPELPSFWKERVTELKSKISEEDNKKFVLLITKGGLDNNEFKALTNIYVSAKDTLEKEALKSGVTEIKEFISELKKETQKFRESQAETSIYTAGDIREVLSLNTGYLKAVTVAKAKESQEPKLMKAGIDAFKISK